MVDEIPRCLNSVIQGIQESDRRYALDNRSVNTPSWSPGGPVNGALIHAVMAGANRTHGVGSFDFTSVAQINPAICKVTVGNPAPGPFAALDLFT